MKCSRYMFVFSVMVIAGIWLYTTAFPKWGNRCCSVVVLNEKASQALFQNKQETEAQPELYYNRMVIPFDQTTGIYYVPQTLNDENWDGIITTKYGKLYFEQDDLFRDKLSAISSNHAFRLYFLDGNAYSVRDVIFGGMPMLSISTAGDVSDSEGFLSVIDLYHENGCVTDISCHTALHGATSRIYPKLSYKISLTEENVSLLGMRNDDDWVLIGLYDDGGMINNKLSYELWDMIAQSNRNDFPSPQFEYVELFLNHQYAGVYGLLERIDKKEYSLKKKDILYKGYSWELPEEFSGENYNLAGGFEIKYPKEYDQNTWKPMRDYVAYFCKNEEADLNTKKRIINLSNAIDYDIFLLINSAYDNTRKNTYYVAKRYTGYYQLYKVPWDLNMAFGCDYWPEVGFHSEYITNFGIRTDDINYLLSVDYEAIAEMLYSRWKELRGTGLSAETISEKLEEQIQYLKTSGAYERNYAIWPEGSLDFTYDNTYRYIRERIPLLDTYISELTANQEN